MNTSVTQNYKNEVIFLKYLSRILEQGRAKGDRTGTGTISSDSEHLVFDISNNHIPLPSTRPLKPDFFIIENIWFLSGSNDVEFLKQNNVSIWDDWVIPSTARWENSDNPTGQDMLTWLRCKIPDAYKQWKYYRDANHLGRPTRETVSAFWQSQESLRNTPMPRLKLVGGEIGNGAYGPMWRKWPDLRLYTFNKPDSLKSYLKDIGKAILNGVKDSFGLSYREVDQFADAIKMLRSNPESRRIIVSAWNPTLIEDTVLPACHSFFQFISYDGGEGKPRDLTVKLYQR